MRRSIAAMALLLGVLAAPCLAGTAAEEDALFEKILTYEFNGNGGDLQKVADLMVASHGDAAARARIETKLVKALQSPKATYGCKQFICRQLMVGGTAKSVPALAALLTDEKLSHMARYALGRMTCPEATAALRNALGKTKGRMLIGVIGSVGSRRDTAAVGALVKLARDPDEAVAGAAIGALGRIAGPEAMKALIALLGSGKAEQRLRVVNGVLLCADALVAAGKTADALPIYTNLNKATEPAQVRAAALRGMIACGSPDAMALVVRGLSDKDANAQRVAVGLVRDLSGKKATAVFAAQLPKLPAPAQALLISALAERGDPVAGSAILAAAKSVNKDVRAAAMDALGSIGSASAVPVLATATTGEDRDVARRSLARLSSEGVEKAIVGLMHKGEPKVRAEMARILVARGAKGCVSDLAKAALDSDADVRTEALRALGILGDASGLPPLVKLMLGAKAPAERRAAEKAVIAVAGRVKDENERTRAMVDALPTVKGAAKGSLLRVIGRFGGADALKAITAAVKDPDPVVQDAAIRTLVAWPDASPADTLLDLAKNAKSLTHRVLALRGYINVVALDGSSPAATILGRYEGAMALAKRVEDKRLVLAGIASVRHPDAIKALARYQADPALKAEAGLAIQKVKDAMKAPSKVTASPRGELAKNAIDGDMKTRWDTGTPMKGGEWFTIELPVEQQITK
ncbi:HEAT repeat domain-containing protein, partial [bacterium]|nr:HEAT repeat domain-containing protein [bacterium]